MKKIVLIGIAAGGALVIAGGGGYVALRHSKPRTVPLLGDNFSQMRLEALSMFPPGEKADTVVTALKELGFHCSPMRRLSSNVNAPFVQCDSAGRNYPYGSHYELTIMTRNGVVADIAIGNGLDGFEASVRTPHPVADGSIDGPRAPTG